MKHKIKSYKLSDYSLMESESWDEDEWGTVVYEPGEPTEKEATSDKRGPMSWGTEESKGVISDFNEKWDGLKELYDTKFLQAMKPLFCAMHTRGKQSKAPNRPYGGQDGSEFKGEYRLPTPVLPASSDISVGVIKWSDLEDYKIDNNLGARKLAEYAQRNGAAASSASTWKQSVGSDLSGDVWTTSYFHEVQEALSKGESIAIAWPSTGGSGKWEMKHLPGGYLRAADGYVLLISPSSRRSTSFRADEPNGSNINDGDYPDAFYHPDAMEQHGKDHKDGMSWWSGRGTGWDGRWEGRSVCSAEETSGGAGRSGRDDYNPQQGDQWSPEALRAAGIIEESTSDIVYKGIKTIDVPHVDTTDESLSRGSLIRKRYWGRY